MSGVCGYQLPDAYYCNRTTGSRTCYSGVCGEISALGFAKQSQPNACLITTGNHCRRSAACASQVCHGSVDRIHGNVGTFTCLHTCSKLLLHRNCTTARIPRATINGSHAFSGSHVGRTNTGSHTFAQSCSRHNTRISAFVTASRRHRRFVNRVLKEYLMPPQVCKGLGSGSARVQYCVPRSGVEDQPPAKFVEGRCVLALASADCTCRNGSSCVVQQGAGNTCT